MPGQRSPATGPDQARSRLDRLLARAVTGTGAYGGGLYLLTPDAQSLQLEAFTGFPVEFIAPWKQVNKGTRVPVTDALRTGRLVWIGAQGELASRYPRTALILPYHFCLGAAPVVDGETRWGSLMLLWPGTHPEELTAGQRDRITAACDGMAAVLGRCSAEGTPLRPAPSPRKLARPRSVGAGPAEALAAVAYADRLPEGCCALDLDGRITYISRRGAELVGRRSEELVGTLPWRSLPWLADPVYEDRYRATVVSRQPTAFTALRPPDSWLTFQLYPGPTGLSTRITPAHVPHVAPGPPGQDSDPAGPTRLARSTS